MAKSSSSSGKTSGPSRVRFIMVEAEIADGDLGQITQAIQNALRSAPAASASQRIASSSVKASAQDIEVDEDLDDTEEVSVEEAPRAPKPKVNRPPAATPEVLDLDMTTDVSLADYVKPASPKSHNKRFLLIASWFKEHRDTHAVSAAHIYTGYRTLKWPLNLGDFTQPLRVLKSTQLMTFKEKGHYALNHLGIAEVEKMLAGSD